MSNLEAINETSYLSVPNAPVYRKIMRCFYREYEKMNFKMYKEDIFRLLKQDDMFLDYTLEQLVMDLDGWSSGRILHRSRTRAECIRLQNIRINSISIRCLSTQWKLNV